MPLRLDAPWFLLLVPLAALAVFATRSRVLSLWGWRRDVSAVVRVFAVAGFALALAQPTLRVADDSVSTVIAIDESASITPTALASAQTWIDQHVHSRRAQDRIGLLAFAGDVRIVQPLAATDSLPRLPD